MYLIYSLLFQPQKPFVRLAYHRCTMQVLIHLVVTGHQNAYHLKCFPKSYALSYLIHHFCSQCLLVPLKELSHLVLLHLFQNSFRISLACLQDQPHFIPVCNLTIEPTFDILFKVSRISNAFVYTYILVITFT